MPPHTTLQIAKRTIGHGHPCFIVAEISANHHKDFQYTKKLIKAIASTGADAVKLQTYRADTITLDSDRPWFQIKDDGDRPEAWKKKTLFEIYKEGEMPWEWQPRLKKYAENLGLVFFSTPFDETAVDFLETMRVPCYKIASYEMTDIPLLAKVAQTKKPVIISRGMATLSDIRLALKTLRAHGASQIALLHCVSEYPAPPEIMNLATISDLQKRFRIVTGLSDHTLGVVASVTAVALGASIIEKHITLNRKGGGLDDSFSLEPHELKELVTTVRQVEKMIGSPHYGTSGAKEKKEANMRRSLFVVADIKKGERFTLQNIRAIRPGAGLHPKFLSKILGKEAKQDISRGTPIAKTIISF